MAGFPNIADCAVGTTYYRDELGVRRRVSTDSVAWLNETWLSVAHVLRRVGYYTVHLGKWHVGCEPGMPPPDAYGWNLTRAWNANPIAWPSYDEKTLYRWLWEDKHAMSEAMLADAAAVVARHKLFYMSVNPVVPHAPLSPRREHMEAVGPAECDLDIFWADQFAWSKPTQVHFMEDPLVKGPGMHDTWRHRQSRACVERVYRASVYSFDILVGDMLAMLELNGLADDTMVIVTSDNGPEVSSGVHRPTDPTARWSQVGLATPFRGFKRSLYEGGLRMPCLVRWPRMHGRVARIVPDDVLSVDILPTLAHLAHADFLLAQYPDRRRVGRIARVLVQPPDVPPPSRLPGSRVVCWEWAYDLIGPCDVKAPRFAISSRDTGLKLLLDFSPTLLPFTDGVYGPLAFRRHELYNLTADPNEATDLLRTPEGRELWSDIALPLAKQLVRWTSFVLPRTAGTAEKYHTPCPRRGRSSRPSGDDDDLLGIPLASFRRRFKRGKAAPDDKTISGSRSHLGPLKHLNGHGKTAKRKRSPRVAKQRFAPLGGNDNDKPPSPIDKQPKLEVCARRVVLPRRRNWLEVHRYSQPSGYDHLHLLPSVRYWCVDNECYAGISRPPSQQSHNLALGPGKWSPSEWLRRIYRPRGFIIVGNDMRVATCLPSPTCVRNNWTVVRIASCDVPWPRPDGLRDLVILGSRDGTACRQKFRGRVFKVQDPAISPDVIEPVFRLPAATPAAPNARVASLSIGATALVHLRRAFPHAPLIIAGSSSLFDPHLAPTVQCANRTCLHNFTWEHILLASIPKLYFISDIEDFRLISARFEPFRARCTTPRAQHVDAPQDSATHHYIGKRPVSSYRGPSAST